MLKKNSFARAIAAFSTCALLALGACGLEKAPVVAPDYGTEEDALAGKEDSATAPASIEDLALGTIARATFTRTAKYRAYRFAGRAGQRIEAFVDGLAGLDTVLHIYKVSTTTKKPFGAALATNDDTATANWFLRTNTRPNVLSSSLAMTLAETRTYALVATTYRQRGIGSAEVVVKAPAAAEQSVTVAQLLATPSRYDGQRVKVTASPEIGVPGCTKIGCPATNACCNQCSGSFKIGSGAIVLEGAAGAFMGCTGNNCDLDSCTGFPSQTPGSYELRGVFKVAADGTKMLIVSAARAAQCQRGGCSGQLCDNGPGMVSTCIFRPEYACYRAATCEAQAAGHCGWTQTASLAACLANPPRE